MRIPGQWLTKPGAHAVNVVAAGANYNQSTASADFWVEACSGVEITSPDDGFACVLSESIPVSCAQSSTVALIRILVEKENEPPCWLVPDRNGLFEFHAAALGEYTLTPCYAETEAAFAAGTAFKGSSVSISVVPPAITALKQDAYRMYAYYIGHAAPTFTGTKDDHAAVHCDIACMPSLPGGAAPSAGDVVGQAVSFPVYILTEAPHQVCYNTVPCRLLNLPDGTTGPILDAGTEMTVLATWGAYTCVSTAKKTGFVPASVLQADYTPSASPIVSVTEPSDKFIATTAYYHATVKVQGNVKGIRVQTTIFGNAPMSSAVMATQSTADPSVLDIAFPIRQPLQHEMTLWAIGHDGKEYATGVTLYAVGCLPFDKTTHYSRYLDVPWVDEKGNTLYLGWEDLADYSFTRVGSCVRNNAETHDVYSVCAKDGSYQRLLSLRRSSDYAMVDWSTAPATKRALIISCYMEKETGINEYGEETQFYANIGRYDEDAAYNNEQHAKKIYTALGISPVVISGPTDSKILQRRISSFAADVDYNDITYIHITSHGWLFRHDRLDVFVLADNQYLETTDLFEALDITFLRHYSTFRFIFDACYPSYLNGTDQHGHQITVFFERSN